MFGQNKLAQLYPHLNLSRTMANSVKPTEPPKPAPKPTPVVQRSISIERPKRTQTPQPPPSRATSIEPPKEPVAPKQVKIEEPPKEEVRELTPPKEEPIQKVVTKRPNRVKPPPKPVPLRDTQVPQKGERGLQRKYTAEQRKQMYLDRLSRKSVKNAEREVVEINKVLDSVGGTEDGLVKAEKAIRGQLKLINYAKYFCHNALEEEDNGSINIEHNDIDEPKASESEDEV